MLSFSKLQTRFMFIIFYIKRLFLYKFKATIVSAMDDCTYGIGFEGAMPWHIKSDLKNFKIETSQNKYAKYGVKNVLICGRKTYESLGRKNLPGRHMIVITRNPITYFNSITNKDYLKLDLDKHSNFVIIKNTRNEYTIFLKSPKLIYFPLKILAHMDKYIGKIFIIGGSKIYNEFIINKFKGIKVDKSVLTFISNKDNKHFRSVFNGRYDSYFPFKKLKEYGFKAYKSRQLEEGVKLTYYENRV